MKYVVLLCDGMSDHKIPELGNKTPMTAAFKPNMEKLAGTSVIGMVKTVADGLKPDSDIANLSVLGYDPKKFYTGRSPLEAVSIGIDLKETDITLRCNLVTLSDAPVYEDKIMTDYCAGDISTEEASEIIQTIEEKLGNEIFKFYSGVSYRHCLVWDNGIKAGLSLMPPHNITGEKIGSYLIHNQNSSSLIDMMKKSYDILKNHPINKKRIENNKKPANSIWLWGEGSKTTLQNFEEKYGIKGAMVSAVDLLKGIAGTCGMEVMTVPGATGYIDTNFGGKAEAALKALKSGNDFVYVHVEAPDECGHRFEIQNKVRAIELIDEKVLLPILKGLDEYDDYKILILPDHPTPAALGKHVSEPVPFLLHHKNGAVENNAECFDEENAAKGIFCQDGTKLLEQIIQDTFGIQ